MEGLKGRDIFFRGKSYKYSPKTKTNLSQLWAKYEVEKRHFFKYLWLLEFYHRFVSMLVTSSIIIIIIISQCWCFCNLFIYLKIKVIIYTILVLFAHFDLIIRIMLWTWVVSIVNQLHTGLLVKKYYVTCNYTSDNRFENNSPIYERLCHRGVIAKSVVFIKYYSEVWKIAKWLSFYL